MDVIQRRKVMIFNASQSYKKKTNEQLPHRIHRQHFPIFFLLVFMGKNFKKSNRSHLFFSTILFSKFIHLKFYTFFKQQPFFAHKSSFFVFLRFTFGNYLFKYYSKTIIILRRKGLMRKHGYHQLQKSIRYNKYDQFTNLGIDLEASLNKSIILPKIVSKMVENDTTQYLLQRKAKEDREMLLIKDEIDRLKERIYHLDDKKIVHRLKNEDRDPLYHQNPKFQQYKQSFHMPANENFRNQTQVGTISKFQRNNDKDSLQRQETSSIFIYKSQAELSNPILQAQTKQKKASLSKGKDQKNTFKVPFQTIVKNKKTPKSNGKLKKRFRIVAFAVYFSLFMPAYAKKHYQNQLKLMIQQYPYQVEKYSKKKSQLTSSIYKIDEAKLWNYFDDKLNVLDAIQKNNLTSFLSHGQQVKKIKDYFQFLINNELNTSQKSLKEQHTIIEQIMFPKNTQYLIQGFQTIFTKFIDNFTSFISKTDFFQKRWKTFSLGIINNYFIHNSHPKLPSRVIQSGIVRLHPFKQVLLVYDQQAECLLLGYDIMCRIFLYKWMVKLQKMKQQAQCSEQVRTIASFMITLFYLVWQKILNEHLQTFIDENGECQRQVIKRNKRIRPIVPLLVKTGRRRDEQLLKTDKLISNPPFENEAAEVIENNDAFVLTLKGQLKSIGSAIYQKLKIKMNQQSALTKAQTLAEKNIFDNGSILKAKQQMYSFRQNKQNGEYPNKHPLSTQKTLRIKLRQ